MRPRAKRFLIAGVLLLTVSVMLSGCIVCVEDTCHDGRPPRMATLQVYALDYYTGTPIPWAQVELYESDWWTWDYEGTWSVGPSGYVVIPCGYMYPDGCSGQSEEDYRVVVYASGYHTERYDIELSYYYPSEVLSFYLMPYYARDAGEGAPGTEDGSGLGGAEAPEPTEVRGKVVVGEPEEAVKQ